MCHILVANDEKVDLEQKYLIYLHTTQELDTRTQQPAHKQREITKA